MVTFSVIAMLAMYGFLWWSLSASKPVAAAVLVSMFGAALFTELVRRAWRAGAIATVHGLQLRGLLRTRRFGWNEISSFEIWDWFGSPALWVELNDDRKRRVFPFFGQTGRYQREVPDYLKNLRDELLQFRAQIGP
ncbi:MAG: hypothetical protein K8R99_13015 [Actinomycetia bacterium]|nr:hypothetical protein [Actinomycetes bacterium]